MARVVWLAFLMLASGIDSTAVEENLVQITTQAGEVDETGAYPAESINGRVFARLERFANSHRRWSHPDSNKDKPDMAATPKEA